MRTIAIALVILQVSYVGMGNLNGDDAAPRIDVGPAVAQKISEFRSTQVSKQHLCWSCYG